MRSLAVRETQILASLRHPNIVRYHRSFTARSMPSLDADDSVCVVMAFCGGEPHRSNGKYSFCLADCLAVWPAGLLVLLVDWLTGWLAVWSWSSLSSIYYVYLFIFLLLELKSFIKLTTRTATFIAPD